MCWLPRLPALRALFQLQVGSCGLLVSSRDIRPNARADGSTGTSSARMGMILRLFVAVVGAILGCTPVAVFGVDWAASAALPVRTKVFLLQRDTSKILRLNLAAI